MLSGWTTFSQFLDSPTGSSDPRGSVALEDQFQPSKQFSNSDFSKSLQAYPILSIFLSKLKYIQIPKILHFFIFSMLLLLYSEVSHLVCLDLANSHLATSVNGKLLAQLCHQMYPGSHTSLPGWLHVIL